jgi:hypothetical protein
LWGKYARQIFNDFLIFNFFTASQLRGDANFALVATASAFLAVGFSRPSAQAHDELKSIHRGYQGTIVPP